MTEPAQIIALVEEIETFVGAIAPRDIAPHDRGAAISMALIQSLARHLVSEFPDNPSAIMGACALAQRQLGETVRGLFIAQHGGGNA